MSINGNSELIVRYDGSKASFESTNGPKNTYIEAKVSKVVFITGSTATNATAEQKCQYIWITDGSSDKYINMSNVADIQKSLTHIAGFAIDGSQATIGAGQNGLNFVGTNGIKITLNPTTAVDKNGVPYWSIEIDGDDIKAIVESADAKASSATAKIATILGVDGTSNKSIRMIASEEAGKVETALKGNSSTDSKDSATIAGAKKYADAAIDDLLDGETIGGLRDDIDDLKDNKADLENGRIPTSQLPDYILGQLLFGGTAGGGTETQLMISPSLNYQQKHKVPDSQEIVIIDEGTFEDHEGEYFIATAGFTALRIPVNTGDWIVSTGTDWKKIDNTDAITKVAGVVPKDGDIPKAGLVTALGIDNKVEQTVYDAKVAELEASIGGKYTKPAGGIPAKDLAAEVATETEVVNAISKAAAGLNDKIDSKVGKYDLKDLKYTVNGTSSTYNGLSEATMPQIFAPTTIGSQGQLLQSMGGGAPQWTNLSAIKEAIGFAKDLTGVLEATPEEFTFRPSAGNKSIRDEGAVIRRIKGNTTVWEQRGRCTVKNWMFEPYGDNGMRQHRQSADIEWSGWEDNAYLQYPQGDKILVEIIPLNNNYLRNVNYFSAFGSTIYINEPKIVTASGNGISMRCSPESIGFIFIPQIHNLTRLFGAGNEPTTVEEFRAIYPDIYPYCEPEIRNVKTTAIETVGFNLFNGEYADLIGGKTYYVGGTDGLGLTFTPNGTESVLNVVLGDSRTFTPTQSGRLYSTNTNTCVHFQHSGIKDGECADYIKHTLELPEIANYFQYGMNGNSNVWDEINAESAITRWGVVDLGSIDDYTYTGSAFRSSFLKSKMSSVATLGDYNENMICELYDNDRWSNSPYKIQFTVNNGYLWINNPDYTDIDSFKAAMSGVLLYYELAEPIVTPISEPIQLVYDVEDFGTERAIAPENSAPFRADIVYQFNAEGRIRDNGRNIERLENKIRSYHDDGAMVTIDREIITTKSIIGNSEFRYALPDAPQDVKDDADGTLATEFWVQKNIPTEVATAMMKESLTSPRPFDAYNPNIVYEFAGSLTELTIGMLIQLDGNYDHVWIIRFGCSSVINLSISPKVYWKDGIEPIFGDWGICELKFHTSPFQGEFLGEWKIYR